jgi:UDP-N-acetylglucosamine 2-epimerase (non-hydrolysing)
MNRRVITKLATYHFAATERNRATLLAEGVTPEHIFLTGNPVVDALTKIMKTSPSPRISELVRATAGMRRLVLTTHRRESFGSAIVANLRALRGFVDAHEDVALIFPVHPNPEVTRPATRILGDHPRVHLLAPLAYQDFIALLAESWLIVSDSGGVQEEAPTLGKPVLVLRENTERPEAVEAGVARVVGGSPEALTNLLEQVYGDGSWMEKIKASENPFGNGDAAVKIVNAITAIVAPETADVLCV